MKRSYSTPILLSRRLELGVFGDYGQDGGNDVVPEPDRFDGFELRLE
jgi:hypothetical protein